MQYGDGHFFPLSYSPSLPLSLSLFTPPLPSPPPLLSPLLHSLPSSPYPPLPPSSFSLIPPSPIPLSSSPILPPLSSSPLLPPLLPPSCIGCLQEFFADLSNKTGMTINLFTAVYLEDTLKIEVKQQQINLGQIKSHTEVCPHWLWLKSMHT